jgi:hypothetical protein
MHVEVQEHLKKPCIVIMNEHITQSGDDYEISTTILVHMKCGQGCMRYWKHEAKDFALKTVLKTKCVGLVQ